MRHGETAKCSCDCRTKQRIIKNIYNKKNRRNVDMQEWRQNRLYKNSRAKYQGVWVSFWTAYCRSVHPNSTCLSPVSLIFLHSSPERKTTTTKLFFCIGKLLLFCSVTPPHLMLRSNLQKKQRSSRKPVNEHEQTGRRLFFFFCIYFQLVFWENVSLCPTKRVIWGQIHQKKKYINLQM